MSCREFPCLLKRIRYNVFRMRRNSDRQSSLTLKRAMLLLIALAFLAVASGGVNLLHDHHEEGDHSHPCQVCFLVTMATVALALAFIYLFFIAEKAHGEHPTVLAVVRSTDRLTESAPRAPPRP